MRNDSTERGANGSEPAPQPDELRLSEARYRALIAATKQIVWSYTIDGGVNSFTQVEEWWEGLTGQTVAEQRRSPTAWLEVVHPGDRDAVAAAWGTALASGDSYDIEYRIRGRADAWHYILARGVPIAGATGGVREWVGTLTEVTEQRRAEADRERLLGEVEGERRKLAEVFQHAPSFMCVLRGPGHVFERVNDRYLDLLDRRDLIGRPVRAAVPEVEGQGFFEILDRVYRTGEPFVGTNARIVLRRGGVLEERYLDFVYQPLRDPDGTVSGIIVQGIDLTERKVAEDQFQEERDRFARLAATAPGVIHSFRRRPDGTVSFPYASPGIADVYGVPPEALRADATPAFERVHPGDLDRLRASIDASARTLAPRRETFRVRGPSGREIWVEGHSAPVREPDGSVLWHGFLTDVTDRKRDEQTLRYQHALLRSQTEASPDGILVVGPDRRLLSYNRRFLELWGVPEAVAAAGDRDAAMAVARQRVADPGAFDARLAAIAADPDVWTRDEIPLTDGGTIERYGGPIQGPDGEPFGRVWYFRDVTEAKRSGAEIREREQLLGIVTASARLGLVMVSDEFEYLFANEGYAEILGRPVRDIVGRRVPDLMPGRWAHIRPHLDRALAGEWNSYEVARPAEPGRPGPRWFRVLCEPRRVAGERPRVVVVVMEITDQKRAEEAVRASEERYRRLVDVLPVAVFVHDGDAITYCNPAYVRLMGAAAADQLLGTNPFDRVHPDYHGLSRARIAEMARSGRPMAGVELRAVRLDGRTVPVYSVSTPLPGPGRPAYLIVLTDLTERERSAELLRAVLGSVGDSILTTDERGTIQSANPAAERAFGFPESDLVGTSTRVLLPALAWGGPADPAGAPPRPESEAEGHRRDGSTFPAELTVTEFRLDGERHYTAVVRDTTARKKLEAQFRQAHKMEAFGQLAGGVAHDFNNLLTVINGYAALLLKGRGPDDPDAEPLREVLTAGRRAEALTRQLLAFGRRQVLQPKELDLNDLITHLTKMLGRLLGEDVRLATALSPSLGRVTADPGQLEQMIVNLSVNARDAMPTGGRLTIETDPVTLGPDAPCPLAPGRYARVTVSDTGCGMTDEVREHIFEPFFTTKAVGQGTGLGLSTVFGIVEQSGGHIAVASAVGRGTTFEVLLPVTGDAAPAATAREDPSDGPTGRETVLLVEDEGAVRALTALFLRRAGYTVLEAGGAAEAIRVHAGAGGAIRLLLTDVVMPTASGRELAERLVRASPDLRVLFMSGYTDDRVVRYGIQSSEVAFIQKPFEMGALLVKVREVLGARALG